MYFIPLDGWACELARVEGLMSLKIPPIESSSDVEQLVMGVKAIGYVGDQTLVCRGVCFIPY